MHTVSYKTKENSKYCAEKTLNIFENSGSDPNPAFLSKVRTDPRYHIADAQHWKLQNKDPDTYMHINVM